MRLELIGSAFAYHMQSVGFDSQHAPQQQPSKAKQSKMKVSEVYLHCFRLYISYTFCVPGCSFYIVIAFIYVTDGQLWLNLRSTESKLSHVFTDFWRLTFPCSYHFYFKNKHVTFLTNVSFLNYCFLTNIIANISEIMCKLMFFS